MVINRKWFFVMNNGKLVLDWGQGKAQEVTSGKFVSYVPKNYAHAVEDQELIELVEKNRIVRFDQEKVVLKSSS